MFFITDKPIKYIVTGANSKNILFNLPNQHILEPQHLVDTIKTTYTKNYDYFEYQKFLLKYDKNLTPLFELRKFQNIGDNYELIFVVKRHSRNILPFKSNIKFRIPSVIFTCTNIFPDKYLKNIMHVMITRKNNLFDRGHSWVYGNVFHNANICFGNMQARNLYQLIESAPKYKIFDEQNTQTIYLNIFMSYIYSLFFDTAFNADLADSRYSFLTLIDFKDINTRNYIENYLKKKHPQSEYLKKHNYSLIYLLKHRQIHQFLSLIDIWTNNEQY